MGIAQYGIGSQKIVRHSYLTGVGHIAAHAAGHQIVLSVMAEIGGSLPGEGGIETGVDDGFFLRYAAVVLRQLVYQHLLMIQLHIEVALTCGFVHGEVKVPCPAAIRLEEGIHKGIGA